LDRERHFAFPYFLRHEDRFPEEHLMSGLRFARFLLVGLSCVSSSIATLAQISAQPTTNLPSHLPTETNRPVEISGHVALEDGTPLNEPVEVQRVCGNIVKGEVYSDSRGNFTILLDDKSIPAFQSASEGGGATMMGADMGSRVSQTTRTQLWGCDVRALLPGYTAGAVSLAGRDFSLPVSLGAITLRRIGEGAGATISATALQAPEAARKEYDKGRDEFAKKKFADADKHLTKAIELYPKYASALDLRGREQRARHLDDEAEKSFADAISADDKYVPPYLHLAQLHATHGKWPDVVRLSDKAIELDAASYPDPYYFKTVAHIMLKQIPDAKRNVSKVLELDRDHRFPRAELIMGNILRSENNIPAAAEHFRKYIQLDPSAREAPDIQAYLDSLQKPDAQAKPAPKPN